MEMVGGEGKNGDALEVARKLTQLSPESAHPHLLVAGFLIDKGDFEAADAELRLATRLNAKAPGLESIRCHLLLRRGDVATAEKQADRGVSLTPGDSVAYSTRAQVLRAIGEFPPAIAH